MKSIEIKGYKSIKRLTIDLRPINILIGANGSGKSNFVSFFDFLYNLYELKLNTYIAKRGGVDKFLHHGRKQTEELYFYLDFDINGYAATIVPTTDGRFFFKEENLYFKGNPWGINPFNNEAQLKYSDLPRASYIRNYITQCRKYHFHDTGVSTPFAKSSHIDNDQHYLYADGHNLAAYLYNIQKEYPTTYRSIVSVVKSVAPYFSDFFLHPNSEGYINLQWTDKYSDTTYGVEELSDGTLRFIALTVLFLQPNLPNTIIIDEPELGLHPFAIAKLAGLIQSAAQRKCQVIAATQSAELISYFEPKDIIAVDQQKGESFFKRLSAEELSVWLDNDYTLGELWVKSIIAAAQPNY
ncbi:MAG: AAA family ATPase [Bacteroidales bacterium]|nr:AAA family ATPase [Bacteroidales bacterium]